MPCPFFFPLKPAEQLNGPIPGRAPLHAIHEGACRASDEQRMPTLDVLERFCNFGYGRRGCEWFPAGTAPDAVRFSHRGGDLIYVLERGCFPEHHGPVAGADEIIRRQAEVFLEYFPSKERSE